MVLTTMATVNNKSHGGCGVKESDLIAILDLYLAWFHRAAQHARTMKENRGHAITEAAPNIVQVSDAARDFLLQTLDPGFPVHFALSVFESVAYVTAQFASADRANRSLYRDAALRILKAGLPLDPSG
jgi:hypothetical protein